MVTIGRAVRKRCRAVRGAYDVAEYVELRRGSTGAGGKGAGQRLDDEQIGCEKRNP